MTKKSVSTLPLPRASTTAATRSRAPQGDHIRTTDQAITGSRSLRTTRAGDYGFGSPLSSPPLRHSHMPTGHYRSPPRGFR
jgi:hypothetical protein